MRKIVAFLLCVMTAMMVSNAQSLSFIRNGSVVLDGDTVHIALNQADLFNEDGVKIPFEIKNNTTDSIVVKFRKTSIQSNIATFAFCDWFSCFEPTTNVSPTSWSLRPQEVFPTDYNVAIGDSLLFKDFHVVYYPNESAEYSLFKLNLYDIYNQANEAIIYIDFTPDVKIENPKKVNNSLMAIPNPASQTVTIKYGIEKSVGNAKVVLKNLMGNTLCMMPVSPANDRINMDISSYPSGIYFYSIVVNDKTLTTKKLVIR